MSLLLSKMIKVKRFLRRYPKAYDALQRAYYRMLYVGENYCWGSKLHEHIWKTQTAPTMEEFEDVMMHPHRKFLVEHIIHWEPFDKILEIGCHSGQNLFLLAQQVPNATFYGIDINQQFINMGQEWCKRYDIRNVNLQLGKAEDLSKYPDKAFDISFSDATLMYLGPDKIMQTIREIVRITRRVIIFNEWHKTISNPGETSYWYDFHWVHDYGKLVRAALPNAKVVEYDLPEGQWLSGGGWEKYGKYIEVEK